MKVFPKNKMYMTFPKPRDGQNAWSVNGIEITVEDADRMGKDARGYIRTITRLETSKLQRKKLEEIAREQPTGFHGD